MRTRLALLVHLALCGLFLWAAPALAAPQAQILRIDPRAGQTDATPILNTVIEVAQNKRMSEALQDCALRRGNDNLACVSEKLSQPRALFSSYEFPERNAVFTVKVDGADLPAKFVSKHKWGESQNIQGVGTAWLIVIDSTLGSQFDDAKAVATAFVNAMGPQDIADVVVFGDRQVISDSKWLAGATQKTALLGAVSAARATAREGRSRPLFTILRTAVTDSFRELGNAGQQVAVPLHQALVVLSSGAAGTDTLTTGAGAAQLNQYLTKGRFPEDNTALPKTPLPTISIYFPVPGLTEEFTKNAQDFMTNLANPEIGGYFNVVRENGAAAGGPIAAAVRDRFNQMFMVRWRVSCVAPTVTQSFGLNFSNVNPQIAGDNSFKDVPIGIDPSTWPLDVNVEYTKQMADKDPVNPGGEVKVYGNFCWGSAKERAQVYFLPTGTAPPAAISIHNVDEARRAQQQLVAMGMNGKAVDASDGHAEFEVPDKDRILWGKGSQAVVRLVVYDTVAKRMSGATTTTVMTLKGGEKSIFSVPWYFFALAGFGLVVLILLLATLMRSGGNKRRRPNPPPGPGGFGGPGGPGFGGPGGPGFGGPGGPGGYPGAPGGGFGAGPGPGGGGFGGPNMSASSNEPPLAPSPPAHAGPAQATAYAIPMGALPGGMNVNSGGMNGSVNGAGLNGAGLNGSANGAGLNGSVNGAGLNGSVNGAGLNGSVNGAGLNGSVNGAASAGPSPEFLYGDKPPQFGLTSGQPAVVQPPQNPYAPEGGKGGTMAMPQAANGAGGGHALLSGQAGTFTITPGSEMRVGRDAAQCQIVLTEPRVSSVHATVKLDAGQVLLRDERSNNGTMLNGAPVSPGLWTSVPPGSLVRFGPSEFSVRLE
ncbi:MAG: FHA domain-containing protein [Polyangiaceae bacterium]|nr:FHA domain-containing protein [Polyangiaceae bacterium]